MSWRRFTPEEDAEIIARYSTETIRSIASRLGEDWTHVQHRIDTLRKEGRLGGYDTRFYAKPWTEAEDDELRGRIGYDPPAAIARDLHRTKYAVIVRSKRLGLSRKPRGMRYTARAVGEIFGTDGKMVTHVWIRNGWLTGQRSTMGAGRSRRWAIGYDDIEAFIRQHPDRYERRRITHPWWRRVADEVAAERTPTVGVVQAAHLLNVAEETVRRHCRRGWLDAKQIYWAGGSMWVIARAELANFRRRLNTPRHYRPRQQRATA